VESLDLSELYQSIKAVDGHVGRNAIDPRLLFALWLFATLEGVSSARRIDELTRRDIPYMWLCGGVSVNYHALSDFRVAIGDLLERLLIDSIAVLISQNLVTLETVAQDGMRVRASAGSGSFRRKKSLKQALAEAEARVKKLREEHEQDPSAESRRVQAAQQRAARDKAERIRKALDQLEEIKQSRSKKKRDTEQTRASTTDPEARNMKMANGGFCPALNVQFATDGDQRLIVGVDVTHSGSDSGKMKPMHDSIVSNYGKCPSNYLVDQPFATIADVTSVERAGTQVYAPLPFEKQQLSSGQDPYARKKRDTDEMATFRDRMSLREAKALYKQRAGIAEFPNADCRNRGLHQFRVRGKQKAKAQALWHALAFNLLRFKQLGYAEVLGIQ
jgi:transposase